MKVSLNWVKQFADVDISVDELVKKIGEQLGAIEEVKYLGDIYRDVVIAKVVACEKHPNADKLSVCTIDDGGTTSSVNRDETGLVHVVCGAPNVKEGMTVAWLPPGSTVPSTFDKDPFVLEARELRGVVSNGMLASAKELAIGDEHEGILEVDVPCEPGMKFVDVYQLDDYIIDIENKMFTHRPDCFGILGVAREIAGIQNQQFISPDWYLNPLDRIKPGKTQLQLSVKNEIPELVPRFVAVALADVKVQKSPVTIQSLLSRVGIKPINNIVDITNYLMILTGQPLHAYDYDKVASLSDADGAVLFARKPQGGEKLALLNGKTIEPRDEAIMIATDKALIGVGGIMGGSDTEVDNTTKNIILECANFDMYSVRRTSMAHGLFTDAVTRFNKGQSPLQNDTVLEEAVVMLENLSNGHVASEVFDEHGKIEKPIAVHVRADFIQSRLGIDNSIEDMGQRLRNVEFDVSANGPTLAVTPPFWRTDIEIAEDVVEEIGRLIGFEKLPVVLPIRPIKPVQKNKLLELKSQIRDKLSAAGANEVLSYSFVHGDLIEKVGQNKEKAFKLNNALSPDLQYYRTSLTPSLLEKIRPNVKAGHDQFAVFEIGKAHVKGEPDPSEPSVPKEVNALSLVYVNTANTAAGGYYEVRCYLHELVNLQHVGAKLVPLQDADLYNNPWLEQMTAPYEPSRSAVIQDADHMIWGVIGEIKSKVSKALKLPKFCAALEIDPLLFQKDKLIDYAQISKYPSVTQDISLKIAKELQFGEIERFLSENLDTPKNSMHNLEPIDIYEKKNDKHITFRLTIASYEKTLKSEEVNSLLDTVAKKAADAFGAERL